MDPQYVVQRLEILDRMRQAVAADEDDDYCEGYDALIALERDAGEFDGYEPGVCRICGCTDAFGCIEGCAWVDEEHTLCSNPECLQKAYPDGVPEELRQLVGEG